MSYCASCGNRVAADSRFCSVCGRELPDITDVPARASVVSPKYSIEHVESGNSGRRVSVELAGRTPASFYLPCGLGILLGALVGFLLRPTVPMIGQLPLGMVLSGGDNLQGLDLLLRSTAQESREYVIIGGIIGLVIGYFVALMMFKNKAVS